VCIPFGSTFSQKVEMENKNSYSNLSSSEDKKADKVCYKYTCQLAYNESKKTMRWKTILNGDIVTCNMSENEPLYEGERLITIHRYYLPDVQIGFHFTPNMETDFEKSESYYYPLTTLATSNLFGMVEKKISKKSYDKIVKSYMIHQKYLTNNIKYNPCDKNLHVPWTEKEAEELVRLNKGA